MISKRTWRGHPACAPEQPTWPGRPARATPNRGPGAQPGRLRHILLTVLLLSFLATAGAAQPSLRSDAWYKGYEDAVEQIKNAERRNLQSGDQLWAEAIRALQAALQVDPEPNREKRVEGRRKKYFPYFYLGIAQMRSGQWDAAEESFLKAREADEVTRSKGVLGIGLGRDEAGEFEKYEAELYVQQVRNSIDRGDPDEAAKKIERARTSKLNSDQRRELPGLEQQVRQLREAVAARMERFDALVGEIEQAKSAGRLADARSKLAEAEGLDPDEFKRRGLDQMRATLYEPVDRLVMEGQQFLEQDSLSQAKDRFQEARGLAPGREDIGRFLQQIQVRESSYEQSRQAGEAALQGRKWAAALDALNNALKVHPEYFERDDLQARIDEATFRIHLASCRQAQANGRFEDAVEHCGRAVAVRNDPEARRRRDRSRSQVLVAQARTQIAVGRFDRSDRLYLQALEADPENEEAARSLERITDYKTKAEAGREAYEQWQASPQQTAPLEDALRSLSAAARLDLQRFQRDGTRELLDMVYTALKRDFDPQRVRAAAEAFYRGEIEQARQSLEEFYYEGGLGNVRLHVFLGMVYASLAFQSAEPSDFAELREMAIEQFRLVRTIDPDYRLTDRLASPLIVKLFEGVNLVEEEEGS